MPTNNTTHIYLVIVLYHPQEEDLRYFEHLGCTYQGCIVDNSEEAATGFSPGKLQYICNHRNLGIAEAQNIALEQFFHHSDCTHVVFFDQDTRINTDYPKLIVKAFQDVQQSVPRLALLGPTVRRLHSGEEYRSVIHRDHVIQHNFIQRRDVISSGCCISKDNLQKIGFNDSRLFIDYVDYEWCWRAEDSGYVCGITPHVSISHKVGHRELRFPFGYRVILSAPVRYFYQYRNFIWLSRRKYVPWQWKMATGLKQAARLLYFPLFVKGGRERFRYMVKGILAGIKQ